MRLMSDNGQCTLPSPLVDITLSRTSNIDSISSMYVAKNQFMGERGSNTLPGAQKTLESTSIFPARIPTPFPEQNADTSVVIGSTAVH